MNVQFSLFLNRVMNKDLLNTINTLKHLNKCVLDLTLVSYANLQQERLNFA